ncbi:MAG: trimeric intracellular cation channel family protein [Bacteroidales bacterium]|nr:trimeric intracellular cation channel family protein [Bacteroidales bacterium]HBT86351.1 trimeric intracellular cation channel family protein [Porphyromonadaceae bacterium]
MENLYNFYYFLDLAGAFAFALSGATAARERGLDLFGICATAFTVACGGGIIRDLCIGAIPPAGLVNWHYLATSLAASIMTISIYPVVRKMNRPVIFFDAAGLSFFAVTGTQKVLIFGYNEEVAILLGITTAVGGGIIRDILLNRVPVVLEKEIYASAAFTGALIVALGHHFNWLTSDWIYLIGLSVCFSLRMLALHFHWNLPIFSNEKTN